MMSTKKPSKISQVEILLTPVTLLKQFFSLSSKITDNSMLTICKQMLIVSIMLYVSICAIIDAKSIHPKSSSSILKNMDRASIVFNMILCIVIILNTRKTRYDYVQRINDFDSAIEIYFQNGLDKQIQHCQSTTNNELRWYLLHFLLSVFYLSVEVGFGWYSEDVIHYRVAILLGIILRSIVVFDFIAVLNMVFARFKLVNHVVQQLIQHKRVKSTNKNIVIFMSLLAENKSRSLNNVGNSADLKRIKDTLTILRLTHESLTMICRDLSEVYGVFHALAILTSLIEEVNQAFSVFIVGLDAEKLSEFDFNYGLVKAAMFMMIIGITHFYFVVFYCSAVENEVIYKIYNEFVLLINFLVELFYKDVDSRSFS